MQYFLIILSQLFIYPISFEMLLIPLLSLALCVWENGLSCKFVCETCCFLFNVLFLWFFGDLNWRPHSTRSGFSRFSFIIFSNQSFGSFLLDLHWQLPYWHVGLWQKKGFSFIKMLLHDLAMQLHDNLTNFFVGWQHSNSYKPCLNMSKQFQLFGQNHELYVHPIYGPTHPDAAPVDVGCH